MEHLYHPTVPLSPLSAPALVTKRIIIKGTRTHHRPELRPEQAVEHLQSANHACQRCAHLHTAVYEFELYNIIFENVQAADHARQRCAPPVVHYRSCRVRVQDVPVSPEALHPDDTRLSHVAGLP